MNSTHLDELVDQEEETPLPPLQRDSPQPSFSDDEFSTSSDPASEVASSEIRGSPSPVLPKPLDPFSVDNPVQADAFSQIGYSLAHMEDRGESAIGKVYSYARGKEYTVEKVVRFGEIGGSVGNAIGIGGKGVYAFLMKAKNPDDPAIVLYHGAYDTPSKLVTQDPRGIGRVLLTANGKALNPQIADWMQKNGENGIVSIGPSLGGTLAALTAIYSPEGVTTRARTFSAPGVHKDAYRKWKKMNANGDGPDIAGYTRQSDPIAKMGWRQPGKLFLLSTTNHKGEQDSGVDGHRMRVFESAGWRNINGGPRVSDFRHLKFVGEADDAAENKPLDERIRDLYAQADESRDTFNKKRSRPSRFRFWSSAGQRIATSVAAPITLVGVGTKRILVGSGQQSDGAMRHGLFAAPFVAIYDASKK